MTTLALVQPKDNLKVTGVVMPYKPPIDKIAALVLVQALNEGELATVSYWTLNECSPEQFAKWDAESIYPIDIGDRKYHRAGVGSATEFVAKEFGVTVEGGSKAVLDMINQNNKTGNLKGRRFAVAHMLREFYELSDDENFHIEVIVQSSEVVKSFIQVEDGQTTQAEEGLSDALPDLVQMFEGCNYSPMTLGRYLRDLWLLGNEPHVIRQKIDWWLGHLDELNRRKAEALQSFEKFAPKEWNIAGTKAVVIPSDNHFFVGACIKSNRWGIRIIVAGTGHTVISTNGYDLSRVYETLEKREPGRWFYQAKMGALINGGPQYIGIEPTAIPHGELVNILKSRCQPKGRR